MAEDDYKKILKLENEVKELKKNKDMLWRAIKSLRGSVMTLSSKEAKREEERRIEEEKQKAVEEYKLNKSWIRRFLKWIGAPTLVIAVMSALMAWMLSMLDKPLLTKILTHLKELF